MEFKEITRNKAQGQRIYDSDGLAASLKSEGGGWGAKTGLYKVETIAQKVKVRKHEVDVDKLCKLLRESKKISNKEIAENLDVPITMVEHWFRTDASFSIPSAEIWFRLKSLLNITTDEFDLPITEFIEKDNVFDTTNRVYDSNGISATLTATGAETGLYAVVKDGTKKGEATVETGDTVNLSYPNSKTRRGRVGKKIAQTLETSMEQYTIVDKPRILDASHRNEGIREYEDYSPTLNSRDYKEPRYVDEGNGMRIRRLTPTECERLQGFPDGWTEGLSDTQRYKTLGNAVTTTVVTAVMERLLGGIVDTKIYTDGSCLGNPGVGGWGAVIICPDGREEELSGGEEATTNNRMEIQAIIKALSELLPGTSVEVLSDSEYVVNTMTKGWKKKLNTDLWYELNNVISRLGDIKWTWVKAHDGNHYNEQADCLAKAAAESMRETV